MVVLVVMVVEPLVVQVAAVVQVDMGPVVE
jgi:hypothetical protein